ncbi:MAG: BTAD domain-containing putative transcriptional regulator [Bacillota bacterium]
MGENKIEVYTLGKFVVKKDDFLITEKSVRSHKLWYLFKILISSPEKVFTAEELMDRLDLSLELIDAKNAIQNLIYRLRKLLAKNEEYNAEKYIIFEKDGYRFKLNENCYIDFINFENYCKKSELAKKQNNYEKAINFSLEAIKIYKGNFLDENKNMSWIIQMRAYLRRLYLEQIYFVCDILTEKEDFIKIEEICEDALGIEPFEEEIHYHLINSLIKQNKIQKAKLHYQYILNLFAINKLKLPPRISNLLEDVNPTEEEQKEEIKIIKTKLNSFGNSEGLCLVDKNSFNYFSWISLRKKEREEAPVFLISVSLNIDLDEINKKDYQQIINYLENILAKTLRHGDVICRWTKIQYLILFNGVDLFGIQEIINRIRKEFYKKDLPQEIVVNLDCIEL